MCNFPSYGLFHVNTHLLPTKTKMTDDKKAKIAFQWLTASHVATKILDLKYLLLYIITCFHGYQTLKLTMSAHF